MADYQTMAIYGDDTMAGSMTPQSLNPAAGSWQDVLLYGLSGAAVNAAYNASNTVGNQPMPGITIGASGNIMPLVLLGVLFYYLSKSA